MNVNLITATAESSPEDDLLAGLLGELTEEFRRTGQVDLNRVCETHPSLATDLRELWGAVMLAEAVAQKTSSVQELVAKTHTGKRGVPAPIPKEIGDYEIIEELGRGGMGVVYRALQKSLNREVALKVVLRGNLAAAGELSRFRQEAQAAAQLSHPHIVPVYEVGDLDGRPYFSMKLIPGETLAQRLLAGPLPQREAAQLCQKMASAIVAAHAQGVLHRDLKPSNILIDELGQPHLTDFGLAKRMQDREGLTNSGAVLGTPAYMAPEQAAGDRGQLGPWTDVYGLGVILYQMLTGRPPFQAATAVDTVLLVLEQDPLPPRLLNKRVDRDLEMIVLKCLQKPVDLRYASAALLVKDLQAYLENAPVSAASGRITHVVARMFRDTHHAAVLENWGLIWMWHSLALFLLCLVTNWMQWLDFDHHWQYALLWGGGLVVWAPIFWSLRSRSGPVTFVERQIAHIWAGSVVATLMLFVVESILQLPVLALTPVLGLISGAVFAAKAGVLSGEFYIHSAALFATAPLVAYMNAQHFEYGVLTFGVVAAATFFFPGLKYYRQRLTRGR